MARTTRQGITGQTVTRQAITMRSAAVLFTLLSSLIASSLVGATAATPEQSIAGDWVISRDLAAGNAAALTPDEIETLLGAQAHYDKTSVEFAGVRCERPLFDSYHETSDNLHQLFELRFEDLGLSGDEVLAIDINCMDADVEFLAGNTVLVAGPNRLVTHVEGVWFELTRR